MDFRLLWQKFTNKTTSKRNYEVRWNLSFILHAQTNQLIGYKRGRKLVKRYNKETLWLTGNNRKEMVNLLKCTPNNELEPQLKVRFNSFKYI